MVRSSLGRTASASSDSWKGIKLALRALTQHDTQYLKFTQYRQLKTTTDVQTNADNTKLSSHLENETPILP